MRATRSKESKTSAAATAPKRGGRGSLRIGDADMMERLGGVLFFVDGQVNVESTLSESGTFGNRYLRVVRCERRFIDRGFSKSVGGT